MKKFLTLAVFFLILSSGLFAQNMGIGTTTPDPSAKLEIKSTGSGLLIPRMTTANRPASPVEGLMIYNTTTHCFEAYYSGNGWVNIGCLGCQLPGAFSATAAAFPLFIFSSVDYNSFKANWTTSASATSYSLDVATDANFTSLVLNNVNVGNVTTYNVRGLPCNGGTTYYYRLRANNACGANTNTNTIQVTTSAPPGAPTATAATLVSPSSFTANWTPPGGSPTEYYLDVATDINFTTFVPGYNNLRTKEITNSDPDNNSTLAYWGVTGLNCNTTYYYRVRAGNACPGANSGTITVTTSACPGTQCGSQIWAVANLNVGTMVTSDGSHANQQQFNNGNIEKYCYNNIESNCTIFGGLYEWGEAMGYAGSSNCDPCGSSGVQGICPSGYHIPTDLEWSRYEYCVESSIAPTGATTLATFQNTEGLRGTATAGVGPGSKMIEAGTAHWGNFSQTNASGFTALSGSYRRASGGYMWPAGKGGQVATFWTATENTNPTYAWYRYFSNLNPYQWGRYSSGSQSGNTFDKFAGFSIRCLKD